MLRTRLMVILGLLVVASMILSACAPAAPTEAPTEAPQATEAPTTEPTEPPTPEPTATQPPTTRHGGWLDEIDFSGVTADSAVTQIKAGAIDLYSRGLASDRIQEIKDSGVCYVQGFGGNYTLLFNPATFTDTTKLNPFSSHKIREAMNYALDRNYINQEIYSGGSLPKYTALSTQLIDYTGVIDVARGIEAKYAYNLDKAKEIVNAEMPAMGAELGADGKWQFNGAPLTLAFIIRNDGDGTRLKIGDYFSDQLEQLGFTVDRQYKKSSEASPIWIGSDPKEGLWNLYTAGWINPGLDRDESDSFQQMYLPTSVQGIPLFTENVADPTFQKLGDDLANGAYTTLEQRHDMINQALPLSVEDSLQVWVIDQQTYTPFQCNVDVTYDLAAGVEAAPMPAYNLRLKDQEGGQLKVGTNDLFTDPWNPINGGNWVWDGFVQSTGESGSFMADPYTGLYWPFRAESAVVTVQSGLPVGKTLDWVTLETADSIPVPADAWLDWDAAAQTFIPAGEGTTAKAKIVVTYPADMYDTVKWHDGSNISAADFVMTMIMGFDQCKTESAIYDEDVVPNCEAAAQTFRGVKVTSTDPLVIETYTDTIYSDAEIIATIGDWWPKYGGGLGEAPWQSIAMGNMAEAAGQSAWGAGKADRNSVEWTNFIGGPSLDVLSTQLDQAIADSTIPFAATLGQFITADDAAARYQALKDWYTARGHFWDATGPYYLDSVDLNAKTAVVKNNPDFADTADRWASFSNPPLAEATLDGEGQITIGQEATFDLSVTTQTGDPYPASDVKEVKFLVYNDKGETVYVGEGVAGGDGAYTLTIPPDAQLSAGAGKIEAAVVLIPVAIPAFASLEFVATP